MIYRANLILVSAICTCVLSPTRVMSGGFDGVGGAPCSGTHTFVARFSSKSAQYSATGTCTSLGSLGVTRAFPYTVKGVYANNIAEEVVEIPAPRIDQPSHPYGTFYAKYSCPSDPWITYDNPSYGGEAPLLKCRMLDHRDVSPDINRPRPNIPGHTVPEIINLWRQHKPMSSNLLMPAEHAALAAQRDKELKAEAEAIAKAAQEKRRLQRAMQPGVSYVASLSPIIRAPTPQQRFLIQTAVPIKLAPPPQWPETNVDINTGNVVPTAQSVHAYMVNIQRKNNQGQWIALATIPVGAINAHSQSGYTGFIPGAPPTAGPAPAPGAWRLNAQVSAPHQTGWSDWVEFHVMTPPSSINARKPGVGFGTK